MGEMFALAAEAEVQLSVRFRHPQGRRDYREEGWGLGVVRGGSALVLRDPQARPDPLTAAALADGRLLIGGTAIGYIRRWTHSAALANCHPFCREWAGQEWLFAHNGALPGLRQDPALLPQRFRPVGTTDSEYAFCLLLDQLAAADPGLPEPEASAAARCRAMARVLHPRSVAISRHGMFNYVLIGQGCLLAFSSGEYGLYYWLGSALRLPVALQDADWQVEVRAAAAPPPAHAVVVASDPMTDGPWQRLAAAQMLVVGDGQLLELLGGPAGRPAPEGAGGRCQRRR